jgi:hypothetical protein
MASLTESQSLIATASKWAGSGGLRDARIEDASRLALFPG